MGLDDEASAHDETMLDDEERTRSRRFLRPEDRGRFIVSHAALRVLLARFLDLRPAAVRYARDAGGKPRLVTGLGPLEFSLSHSGGVGLVAVSPTQPLGVDVEQLREVSDTLLIAEHNFPPAEAAALRSFPAAIRQSAFFRCWTHKEAVIKATGEGLSRPLDSFELELTSATAALRRFDGRSADRCGWSLVSLPAPAGHLAAGAVARGPGEPPPAWRVLAPVAHPGQLATSASGSQGRR